MISNGISKFHTATFANISAEKQRRILEVAIHEFAEKGFNAAGINDIAEKAEISIGSMYSYFKSKDDLFLTIIDYGFTLIEEVFASLNFDSGNVFDVFEDLFRKTIEYTREYRELTQIYQDIATQGLTHLAQRLSKQVESITARLYRDLIARGKAEGSVDPDVDERLAAFCIDNLILILQYSYASEYFRTRMRIFAGKRPDDEELVQGMVAFIRGALSPKQRMECGS